MDAFLGCRAEEVHVKFRLGFVFVALLFFRFPLFAQIEPIPDLTIQPIPIPGGDIISGSGYGLFNQFFPGIPNPPYDPVNR